MTTHSYSSISTYLQCPLRYEAQYVSRRVKDPGSEASRRGDRIHKQLELYIRGTSDEAPELQPGNGLLEQLRQGAKAGRVHAELAVAVGADFAPVDFWSKQAMLRGKIDVLADTPGAVLAIDWKTGKKRENALQGHFYAALVSALHPERPIRVVFDYLEKGRTPAVHYKPDMRDEVRSLVEMVEGATVYPPRPSPLCGWCPVTDCKHHVEGRR